jgi:hypothetical protein
MGAVQDASLSMRIWQRAHQSAVDGAHGPRESARLCAPYDLADEVIE